jgi:hypothetical protein
MGEFERLKQIHQSISTEAHERTTVDERDSFLMGIHKSLKINQRLID